MATSVERADLPLEVLEAISLMLHRHRRDTTPFILSQAIADIKRPHGKMRLSDAAVGEAIIEGAVAARLNVYFDRARPPANDNELPPLDE